MNGNARSVLAGSAALLGGVAGAAALGAARWDRASARMVARLRAAANAAAARVYTPGQLASLPDPVARFFAFAVTTGRPPIRTARVEHDGEFRTRLDAGWSPFRSVQHIAADPPGFVWDARIRMAPLITVRVRDSYAGGRAAMLGKVAALVPVVRQAGTPELASGALHRWLAEAAWIPTALMPRPGLAWHAIDDSTARVTLTDAGTTVSLDVHFDDDGPILRVEAERYRDVDGAAVLTPFVGHFSDYAEVGGVRIPMEGMVEWILPEGRFDYWRGRIARVAFDPAR